MKEKILVIRSNPSKFFVHCIPAFQAIREHHKDAEITLLTPKTLKDLAKATGFFNKFLIEENLEWFMFQKLYRFIKLLRNYGFTRIYDLDNTVRTEWYFRLLGYKKPQWSSSTISWCSHYSEIPNNQEMHFQNVIRDQLKVAGIKKLSKTNLSFLASDRVFEDIPEKYAIICTGGNKDNYAHKYNPEQYAEIIKYLKSEYNITSVLTGSTRGDGVIASYIQGYAKEAEPINYSGRTDIPDFIKLSANAKFCLGNEIASTHIAAYSGCPTIMLCSRFSSADFLAPITKNLTVIEEDFLENVTLERILDAIREGALHKKEDKGFKEM